MAKRLLLIETDSTLRTVLKQSLQDEGYTVTCMTSLREALTQDMAYNHDAMLVDMQGEGMHEAELIKQTKKYFSGILLLMGSRISLNACICKTGIDADDYLVKPFALRDMHQKLSTLLSTTDKPKQIFFGGWVLDTTARTLRDEAGHTVSLTQCEYRLLDTMVHQAGNVFSRAQLRNVIHNQDTDAVDRSIDVAIMRLRRKLGDGGTGTKLIRTIRGGGYTFTAEMEA